MCALSLHACMCTSIPTILPACFFPPPYDAVCPNLYSMKLTHSPHSTHPYTLSPSVCIMFLALPLFLFAGRAKAEPARQTTTKRRKRKNSASSANSSVGTTAGKKRSPATNFSLSSQVPVSISSTRFASFIFFL